MVPDDLSFFRSPATRIPILTYGSSIWRAKIKSEFL